jgi:2'-5' RNA ligase
MTDLMPTPSQPQGNWFAAIPVTLPVDALAEMQRQAPAGLRWFAPEDLHLTVAFFGRFHEERMPAVIEAAAAIPRFQIIATIGHLRPLPSARRFSALSFDLEQGGAEAVEVMQRHHGSLMTKAGVPQDTRPSLPHITVARPSRSASQTERRAILKWAEAVPPPTVAVTLTEIAIYGWAEDRSLRQFRRLA